MECGTAKDPDFRKTSRLPYRWQGIVETEKEFYCCREIGSLIAYLKKKAKADPSKPSVMRLADAAVSDGRPLWLSANTDAKAVPAVKAINF